ncbi:MAG: RNA-binding cell elongation regulator Jag/EloR [Chloroflexota bacterium]|nr:RNA-binding cell elongation regulator Jag/EloR [Chloroflexota bacterium]
MEAREVSARTVEEAVDIALGELNLSRSEVEIEIRQEGKRGILGFGGEDAIVRVTPLAPVKSPRENSAKNELADSPDSIGATAKEIVEDLLSLMDVEGTVQVTQAIDDDSPLTLNINGGDPGILIGRRGQSLSALQYMVNFLTSRKLKGSARVIIDVADYRKRRQEELQRMAWRVADSVRSTSHPITLEPMVAWERRAIHITLRDDKDIATGSVGFGDRRKVIISPRKNN